MRNKLLISVALVVISIPEAAFTTEMVPQGPSEHIMVPSKSGGTVLTPKGPPTNEHPSHPSAPEVEVNLEGKAIEAYQEGFVVYITTKNPYVNSEGDRKFFLPRNLLGGEGENVGTHREFIISHITQTKQLVHIGQRPAQMYVITGARFK
ncbi:MAG: hypothetical protein K2X53_03055 [Alphaproteobacteria bacterium]|nr:hypothetical protein [Alphaproteobacteria bacterium]